MRIARVTDETDAIGGCMEIAMYLFCLASECPCLPDTTQRVIREREVCCFLSLRGTYILCSPVFKWPPKRIVSVKNNHASSLESSIKKGRNRRSFIDFSYATTCNFRALQIDILDQRLFPGGGNSLGRREGLLPEKNICPHRRMYDITTFFARDLIKGSYWPIASRFVRHG